MLTTNLHLSLQTKAGDNHKKLKDNNFKKH